MSSKYHFEETARGPPGGKTCGENQRQFPNMVAGNLQSDAGQVGMVNALTGRCISGAIRPMRPTAGVDYHSVN